MLQVDHLGHSYGDVSILRDVSFALEQGEIACVLGPSGCGKTTLLRCVAGFETLSSGLIRIDGEILSGDGQMVPAENRRVGMVFQDYALMPHLTALQNTAFGLHRMRSADAERKAGSMLERVGLAGLEQRYPHELSGGQQQRVAIARALAPSPALLLMDEPFSNIDAGLRSELGVELIDLFRSLNTTVLVVTHDHQDAFSLADKLGVLRKGELLQWSSAYDVYHCPATRFVAKFVGHGAWLTGEVIADGSVKTGLGTVRGEMAAAIGSGREVDVFLRPDDVVHDDGSDMQAEVVGRRFLGSEFLYELLADDGSRLLSSVPSHHDHPVGERIGIRIETDHIVAFERLDDDAP